MPGPYTQAVLRWGENPVCDQGERGGYDVMRKEGKMDVEKLGQLPWGTGWRTWGFAVLGRVNQGKLGEKWKQPLGTGCDEDPWWNFSSLRPDPRAADKEQWENIECLILMDVPRLQNCESAWKSCTLISEFLMYQLREIICWRLGPPCEIQYSSYILKPKLSCLHSTQ